MKTYSVAFLARPPDPVDAITEPGGEIKAANSANFDRRRAKNPSFG